LKRPLKEQLAAKNSTNNFSEAEFFNSADMMERHINRIRIFKAQASPAYMALTYLNDPVSHAFDCTKKAEIGIVREPEFRQEFEESQQKCRNFAVALLNSCRNSAEVEMVLDDPSNSAVKVVIFTVILNGYEFTTFKN
jgi:hypothetical protein